jgi:hypothetical protein
LSRRNSSNRSLYRSWAPWTTLSSSTRNPNDTQILYTSRFSPQLDSRKSWSEKKLNQTGPLYGHKQAPRVWYSRFASDLFIHRCGDGIVYLLYFNDIMLTMSTSSFTKVGTPSRFWSRLACPTASPALRLLTLRRSSTTTMASRPAT